MTVGTVEMTAATGPLHVMSLANRYADWASVRQATIAGNIANADTPGYKVRDIGAFEAELGALRLQVAATRPEHMTISPLQMAGSDVDEGSGWDVTHSANTVSLDEELAKADATGRGHSLALSVIGSFHRMILSSVSFR